MRRSTGNVTPLLTLVALFALTACSVNPPPATQPELGVAVPETWTADDTAADTAALPFGDEWWRDFGVADLDDAIERALAFNTDLRAAAARVDQAAAQARIAGADLSPQVSAGLSGVRSQRNFVGFPIPGAEDEVLSTITNNYGVSVDISWEIDLWGRLSAQAQEGLAALQATTADFQGARLSVAGQTAKAWFAVAEARLQLELTERTVDSFTSSAQQVRDRFERGIRPPLDLRLALSQQAAATAIREQRRQQLDAATRQLEVLLGLYAGRDIQVAGELVESIDTVPAGLPAQLIGRRPDIVAAERRLMATQQRLDVARASLYPRLSLTASGGVSTAELGSLLDGDFSVWSLAGNLLAPIFQGGRLRAGVDLAEAGVDETMAGYVGTALRAYAEVETALAAEDYLADRVAALQEATEQARAAETLALDRYRSGLDGYVTVLEAQRRTFEAESAWINGRRLRLDNRIDLYLALGGGFDAAAIYDLSGSQEDPPRPDAQTAAPRENDR